MLLELQEVLPVRELRAAPIVEAPRTRSGRKWGPYRCQFYRNWNFAIALVVGLVGSSID